MQSIRKGRTTVTMTRFEHDSRSPGTIERSEVARPDVSESPNRQTGQS
ncbi:hypothetical protein HSR122_0399 [Halapricum desulfuricans]|uniref:Uncharacterized protein n=1 Tax=Halapricum desulfuricans TaxID=2841257 RepID=A0A897N9X0_9EURY|nr:hypothetical protein HSR122_0399 [Halapricum desulfuricans]